MNNKWILPLAFILTCGTLAHAADKDSVKSEVERKRSIVTKEDRESMAKAHEQMASCLRTDKPLRDCRTEMMSSCKSTMGAEGCPMMMMDGRRARMHEMMGQDMDSIEESGKYEKPGAKTTDKK